MVRYDSKNKALFKKLVSRWKPTLLTFPINDLSFSQLLVLGMGLEERIKSALITYTFLVKEAKQKKLEKNTSDSNKHYKVIKT